MLAWTGAQIYEKWSVLSIFGRCVTFRQDFGQVMENIECFLKIRVIYFVYTYVPHGFYFALRSMLVCSSAQTYEECSNLIIFTGLGFFLQVFWQVKE